MNRRNSGSDRKVGKKEGFINVVPEVGIFFGQRPINMKKIFSIGPLFIIIAALLWSFDGLLRRSLYSLPPAVIVFYEHLLGALLLTPFLFKYFHEIKKMQKKEWVSILIVSLFSGALGTIFYTQALGLVQYIQFSVVVLLQQLQPIWAIIGAAIILREKISKHFIIWAVLGIIAAYLITFRDLKINFVSGQGQIYAALLALGAGFVWAISTSFSKVVLNKVSFWTATALRFWIAPVFALLFIIFQSKIPSLAQITYSQWIFLFAITLSTGMVALVIYYYGLRKTPARVSTICELVWPASAIFIDYFVFKQSLTWTQFLGIAILGVSIYHVSKFKK